MDAFLLSADSFSSTGNPALFTRDSVDSPAAGGFQQQAAAPAQPSRFAEARRAAAAAAPGGEGADGYFRRF